MNTTTEFDRSFVQLVTEDMTLLGKVVLIASWRKPELYRAVNGRGCSSGAPNNPIQLGTVEQNPLYPLLKNKWTTRGAIVGWVSEEDFDKYLLWTTLRGEGNVD